MTRAKISTVMKKVVEINFKAVTTRVFTVLLVKLGTVIQKPKGSIDAYTSIWQPYIMITSSCYIFLTTYLLLFQQYTVVSLIRYA